MPALLEVSDCTPATARSPCLHGVGFKVEEGGITTVLGANGAGKTTLLRAVCGMIRPSGNDPPRRPDDHRARDRGHRAARASPTYPTGAVPSSI